MANPVIYMYLIIVVENINVFGKYGTPIILLRKKAIDNLFIFCIWLLLDFTALDFSCV
jgi:hypothetical protein